MEGQKLGFEVGKSDIHFILLHLDRLPEDRPRCLLKRQISWRQSKRQRAGCALSEAQSSIGFVEIVGVIPFLV
jgi:hypothetical protein